MIEIRRILCPIDFSDFSRRALDHAVAIAKWYGASLTLFHVPALVPVAVYPAAGGGPLPAAVLTPENREALHAEVRRFAEAEVGTGIPIDIDIAADGMPPAEILAKAEALPADLVVMGTHGRTGFERLLLGSTTETVLRKARCPVLTVPRHVPDAVPLQPVLFKRILCAIDFSDCSMQALNYAMSLAQEADSQLTIMHVIDLPPDIAREVYEPPLAAARFRQELITRMEVEARKRLNEAVPDTVREYCTVDTLLTTGKPSQEILRAATEQKTDLLVIGIHGRGPVDRLVFGSTAEHLVRRATCPVLTLRTG
jgi:nucleotide-binding universal stress UspA family protein